MTLEQAISLLRRLLSDEDHRAESTRAFQQAIWDGEIEAPPEAMSILRDLAYDLEFFEPNETSRREDPSFYGPERFNSVVRMALRRLEPAEGLGDED